MPISIPRRVAVAYVFETLLNTKFLITLIIQQNETRMLLTFLDRQDEINIQIIYMCVCVWPFNLFCCLNFRFSRTNF